MAAEGRLRDAQPPEWWDWKIEFTAHVLKRMVDRGFSEADLRGMLEEATRLDRDVFEGRWRVLTHHEDHPWEVIVEPDEATETLVVITAYPS